MAPSLPACITNTFCSHRKVSWFLLAVLAPFFLPFFILSVPFLLLFIAPVSVFFFPLLLVYKLQMFLRPKFKRFQRHADKGAHIEGYQTSRQIEAAERLDAHQQAPLAETKGLEGSNVQSEEYIEGDGVDSFIAPSGVREVEQEKLGRLEEDPAVQDSIAEDKTEEKQGEQGPSVEEGREGNRFYEDGLGSRIPSSTVCEFEQEKLGHLEEDIAVHDGLAEYKTEEKQEEQTLGAEGLQRPLREGEFAEGTQEDIGKEPLRKDRTEGLLAPPEARGEEGLQSPEREGGITERTQEDTEKDLLQKDRMEDLLAPSEARGKEGLQSFESERGITDGTQEDTGKELRQKDGREDLLASSEAQAEESLQSPERERGITEGTQEDTGKELQQKDRTEGLLASSKAQGEEGLQKDGTEGLLAPSEAQAEEGLQIPEREREFTVGTKEDSGKELLQKDRAEDLQAPSEAQAEEGLQTAEREREFTEGTKEGMGKEPLQKDRTEGLPPSFEAQAEEGLQTPEREREFTERTHQEDTGKELLQKDRTEGLLAPSEAQAEEGLQIPEAQAEEGLQIPKRESEFTEGTQEDMGKELLQKDGTEDNKQEEKEVTQELIDLKDEQEQPDLYVETPSSPTSKEHRPPIEEGESFDMPSSRDDHQSVPVKPQGQESVEGHSEEFEPEPAVSSEPWEERNEEFVTDTPVTHEHIREESELPSKKDSSSEILDDEGRLDKQEDISFPVEPFEKETEEGEPSYSLQEGHGQLTRESFIKEAKDNEQPQTGKPAKDLATTSEAEASSEREEGYSSEATSSAISPPPVSREGIEFQDRIRDEQKIMADINAIKKIIGYQGEPHASIHEQISELYLFLGMEPYDWAAEVDNLERAQAEIELLKVVVGVK